MYVLRDQAGEIISEFATMPDDFGFPFITSDGRECYWSKEGPQSTPFNVRCTYCGQWEDACQTNRCGSCSEYL